MAPGMTRTRWAGSAPRPALLALLALGLFWTPVGLRSIVASLFAGFDSRLWFSLLAGSVLFAGFGIAHLGAAFGLRAGNGWALVLAAILALFGLLYIGSTARFIVAMTVAAEGRFDVNSIGFWRFNGWWAVGFFALHVLADAVILGTAVRAIFRRVRAGGAA